MKDTFADDPPELRLDMAPMPDAPFVLRYDLAATHEGRRGGLPIQSTEWEAVKASTWEQACEMARKVVHAIPLSRFDKAAPQHLQGVVLVEVTKGATFRTLAFTAEVGPIPHSVAQRLAPGLFPMGAYWGRT